MACVVLGVSYHVTEQCRERRQGATTGQRNRDGSSLFACPRGLSGTWL